MIIEYCNLILIQPLSLIYRLILGSSQLVSLCSLLFPSSIPIS